MKSYAIKGSTLKMIAVITMIIDHVGASILQLMLTESGILGIAVSGITSILTLEGTSRNLALLWWGMRIVIGRIAFPIYCFMLVEGFQHTRSVVKYSARLLGFALVSEIPFDLALFQDVYVIRHQNVFFTLLLGLLGMWGIAGFSKITENENQNLKLPDMVRRIIAYGGAVLVAVICLVAAELLHTDYGAAGVLFILLLYLFRKQKSLQIAVGCVASLLVLEELAAPLAFLLILLYKGERGLKLKYFFYLIYPLHLILLYGVCIMLGLT